MNILTKKCATFGCLFLLIASYSGLHAAKFMRSPYLLIQKEEYVWEVPSPKRNLFVYGYCRSYHIPTDLCFMIRCLLFDNPFQYRSKLLPQDLSEKDLSGFDFTGCHFTDTNLTGSHLAGVILTNTTCDYEKAFQKHIKNNKFNRSSWYQHYLLRDLKVIHEVYPKINHHGYKARLLEIACNLSRLPFYEETEFYIKVQYWSSELEKFKKMLGSPYDQQLVCLLEEYLQWDAADNCWMTHYPQAQINIYTEMLHDNFALHLKEFTNGLTQFQCKSKDIWGFDLYRDQILKSIEGLKAIYPYTKEKKQQQEVCRIAHALSKSYQVQKGGLQNHYLFWQNRLIRLKKMVPIAIKNKIYYKPICIM